MVTVLTAMTSRLFSVAKKTVLITGSSRGIGLMMAKGYYKAGANVIISSRNEQTCKEAVDMIQSLNADVEGGSVRYIPADVSTRDGAEGEFVIGLSHKLSTKG